MSAAETVARIKAWAATPADGEGDYYAGHDAAREAVLDIIQEADGPLDGFTITATLHEECWDCGQHAEQAVAIARATGSTGATHSEDYRRADAIIVALHSATVQRHSDLRELRRLAEGRDPERTITVGQVLELIARVEQAEARP